MNNDDKDKSNPWQRNPYWDRPDPDKLQYSDSPYAPDWAKRPVKTDPAPTVAAKTSSTGFPERIITSGGKPIPDAPELIDEREQIEQSSKLAADRVEDEDQERFYLKGFEAAFSRQCDDDIRAFVLVDGSCCSGIYGRLLNFEPNWVSLWQGTAAQNDIQNGTFLIEVPFGNRLTQWLIEDNWGKGCITWLLVSTKHLKARYARTHISHQEANPAARPSRSALIPLVKVSDADNEPIELLRRHFRRFTQVEMEDSGALVDFRFSDPAVLRPYLFNCNSDELEQFLGPINNVIIENYSRIKPLNKPHEAHEFLHHVKDETDPNGYVSQNVSTLTIRCHDLITGSFDTLSQTPASTEKVGRKTIAGLSIMRNGHIKAYEHEEHKTKVAEIAEQIVQSGFIQKRYGAPDGKVFDSAYHQALRATQKNLHGKREIWAFAVCGLVFGSDFYMKSAELDQAVHARNAGSEEAINLEDTLIEMADRIIGGLKVG